MLDQLNKPATTPKQPAGLLTQLIVSILKALEEIVRQFFRKRTVSQQSIWRIEAIAPTGLSQQIIGSQFMDIDNSANSSTVTRTVQVAREWTKS